MVTSEILLAKRNAGGCPPMRFMPLTPVGLPLDCAHPELSHRHALPPSGPRPFCPSAAARPSKSDRGWLSMRSNAGREATLLQSNLERNTMSPIDETSSSNLTKNKRRGADSPYSRPREAGRQQPRMVRLTVSLPRDLVDRLRDAVYWSPSLTLAWLIAQSLRASLIEMESLRQGPFPKRTKALRAGRPRLVGQTMNVSPRTRLASIGTEPPSYSQAVP